MKILIINVHSGLNLGDDAIMRETLRGISKKYPDSVITIAANDPESWRQYKTERVNILPSICTWIADCKNGIWRKKIYLMPFVMIYLVFAGYFYRFFNIPLSIGQENKKLLLQAYYGADLVLSCGGGNFYAHHAMSPSLVWGLMTLLFAVILGKKTVMLPQSIGVIEGKGQRSLSKLVFSHVDTILLREGNSAKYLSNILHVNKTTKIFPDLAFGMIDNHKLVNESDRDKNDFFIGLSLLDRAAQDQNFKNQNEYEDAIYEFLCLLGKQQQIKVFVFSQVTGPSEDQNDRLIAQRFFERVHTKIPTTLMPVFRSSQEIISSYRQMDLIVGTRMHTGIFALIESVPLLLIGYQPKACGMMNLLGLGQYCVPINDLTADWLFEKSNELILNQRSIREIIEGQVNQMRLNLQSWVDYL